MNLNGSLLEKKRNHVLIPILVDNFCACHHQRRLLINDQLSPTVTSLEKRADLKDKSNTLYEINLLNHGAKRTVLCYARVTNHYIIETSDAYDFLCVLRAFRNS